MEGRAGVMRALILRDRVSFQEARIRRPGSPVHSLRQLGLNLRQHRALRPFVVRPVQRQSHQRVAVFVGVGGVEIQVVPPVC